MTRPPNKTGTSRFALAGSFALLSLAGHAFLIATIEIDFSGHALVPERTAPAPETELTFACASDAAVALGARALTCASPFRHERQACVRRAADDFMLELVVCEQPDEEDLEAEPIAYLDLDEVPQLDIEPLLDVQPIDDIEAAKLIEEEVAEKLEQAQEKISQPSPTGQVVEFTPPDVERPPDSARYLSEYDSSVEKETVARGSTEEMVAKPQPRDLAVSEQPDDLPEDAAPKELETPEDAAEADADGKGTPGDPRPPGLLAMRGEGKLDRPTVDELVKGTIDGEKGEAEDGAFSRAGNSARDRDEIEGGGAKKGGDGGSEGKRIIPNLRPSEELLTRAVGGGSVDKLDGVEEGDFTALNAKKWKFASFFNRMKRQVAQNWHPDRAYIRRDPTGKVYGTKDRITVLQVSLRPTGQVAKIVIQKQSGVGFLDDEAVSAFQKAQPFPNPPDALVDGDGLITFSFGFHFQIGEGPGSWKVFRYR